MRVASLLEIYPVPELQSAFRLVQYEQKRLEDGVEI